MIRKEVLPYLAGSLFLSFFFYLLWLKIPAIFGLIASAFFIYFFRDPDRTPPSEPNVVVSPADGKIIKISEKSGICGDKYKEISIFMSPLDVHVNRIPFDGVVEKVIYTPGKFFSAFRGKAYRENENIKIILKTEYGNIILRQVAGSIARRAVCWVKEGEILKKGERFGMIKFSSRVDICLPETFKILVKQNQKVKAGQTIIAIIENVNKKKN
ncbi:MAG: phosphatidylserine decarboxylase family protein [Thermodesulfovibrionaceae bacterium]